MNAANLTCVPKLVLVPPGALFVDSGQLHASAKFLEGMAQYAEAFPGEVCVVAKPALGMDQANLGLASQPLADLGFTCVITDDLARGLRDAAPDVALVPLSDEHAPLIGVARRTVLTAEHTGMSRLEMARTDPRGPVDRLRIELGFRRLGRRLRAYVARADGVQCNGAVAWNAYAPLSSKPIRVYDNRVRARAIETARAIRTGRRATGPLRLGFSGRLMAIKGPEYAVALPQLLQARGVPAVIDMMGAGPMQAELQATSDDRVRFLGSLDFETQWCDHVARNIDVMVLPHVQSDPSGTYLESAGMGVPVVGFDNFIMKDLAEHAAIGWASPMKDLDAMASLLARLARARPELVAAGERAQGFMAEHCFERDFDVRVQHLVDVMRTRDR